MSVPPYAELHCLSNFSFLRGASHPAELVQRAAELGYEALALTDECSVAGVVRAWEAARDCGLKLIIGSEFTLEDGLRLVLLAADRGGYGRLCRLITRGRRAATKGSYRLARADLAEWQSEDQAGGQAGGQADGQAESMPGCLAIWLPGETPAEADGRWLAECFPGRAWLAVELFAGGRDAARLAALERLGDAVGLPRVACGDVHMHAPGRRPLQDLVTAIRLVTPLHALGRRLFPNAERHLRSRARLAQLYPAALLEAAAGIARRCRFTLAELDWRYPELGYEAYFLTVHDIVRHARSRGILCQGRGSAANSAVCFCLGITEVDPARMSLLFERFISRERNEPPDIDVDFEHERREEVIQYLYAKYGRHRAALAATVICYRPRSALRDVARAMGLDTLQVAALARSMQWWDGSGIDEERVREAGLDPASPLLARVLVLARALLGFPRHLSQHVGGFVIARDLLEELVPVENAAMPDRTVIQWDKDDLDALGLLKVDVLGLGMLTAIRRAFDLVEQHRGTCWTLATVPAEDPAVYDMIGHADTVGVFQIESRAQMAMLPRLKPRTYYDLVIEVAIIRPGPIQGDMVHPYLRRRGGLEPVTYPSAEVEGVLKRTLGVPIFQEQVMQLAIVAAGFTPGEADALRRAMAAWKRKGGLGHFEERLIDGMRERGYAEEFAKQIFRQILGFGEYGFPESHAASFALLVYVSAWLKRHEPAAFAAALINSQPMGFYAPSQLVQDARRHGVEVRPVDALASDWDCTLERRPDGEPALRLGLRLGSTPRPTAPGPPARGSSSIASVPAAPRAWCSSRSRTRPARRTSSSGRTSPRRGAGRCSARGCSRCAAGCSGRARWCTWWRSAWPIAARCWARWMFGRGIFTESWSAGPGCHRPASLGNSYLARRACDTPVPLPSDTVHELSNECDMIESMTPPSILRIIVVIGGLGAPAAIIMAFLVSRFQGPLESVHPLLYLVVLITAMYGAFWLMARKVLIELRDYARHRAAARSR
jgi:error-prone DNA polymerase